MGSSTMYWHLYFTLILMRCGDIEVDPGPSSTSVSDEELIHLSKLIAPGFYDELGVNLGFSLAELAQIKQCAIDTKDAFIKVFSRWRDKQLPDANVRDLLANALQQSELGTLSADLLANVVAQSRSSMTVLGLKIQSLSPDQIKTCRDELKDKYRTDFCMIRADPLDPDSVVPFEDMYTNLFLEEEKRKKRYQLEYKDLFHLKVNGVFPKRIMIQGEAGAGKTTFLAKIAWDWINDRPELSKFVWVLVIPPHVAKRYTIGQIVKSYLSKDNPATACQITEYIRSNPEKVFITCDGLDEFSGNVLRHTESNQGSEGTQPESAGQTKVGSETSPSSASMRQITNLEVNATSFERGDITVEDILRSDELRSCPVMVTCRPWKANEIRWNDSLRRLYTFIHVGGFSRENAKAYIHNYFKDTEATADEFIKWFESNGISENMALYPIYISMLCHMWGEPDDVKKEEFKSFQTFSDIFREVFESLYVRHVQKEITDLSSPAFNTRRSEIEKLMEPIAKLAFTGLESNDSIFDENDLGQFSDSVKTSCKLGVLSQENKLSSIHDKNRPYLQSTFFFPHKLFQEYMAAVYLASLYESDHNEFKRLFEEVVIPRKEEFRYLLYFTVPWSKNISKYVMHFLLQQYAQSRGSFAQEEMNFLDDVAFESRDEDAIGLLRSSVSSLSIDVNDVHTIAGYASTRIHSKAVGWIKLLVFKFTQEKSP
ncbi:NACHT, LRR and PYD domains-containing protein 3-like [Lytechinus pictus]|uniref:NACHT, LRR and PYD domains-containing protein 3-like n=1 Tax=Lytechinus pictus TaxID=7653 RepID=UPI0030BA013D